MFCRDLISSINMADLTDTFSNAISASQEKIASYCGHLVRHIQENPKIAYGSLIVASLLSYEVAKGLVALFQKMFPPDEDDYESVYRVSDKASMWIGAGSLVGLIFVFNHAAKLPLNFPTVVIVSTSTIAARYLIGVCCS